VTTTSASYNYSTFRPDDHFEAPCDGPAPGDDLGGQAVHDLDGRAHRLRDLLRGTTVLETGSTTCPLYAAQVSPMQRVAARHEDVDFAVLYVREAHPGERRGPHRDLDDKLGAARRLAGDAGEWRTVWVDDLAGSLHRTLSASPDTVVVLDGEGRVLAWLHENDATAVDEALDSIAAGESVTVSPRFRPPPPRAIAALARGGRRAEWDFVRGLPTLVRHRLRGEAPC
jgi:hypothetical protein